ncbi:hypothetical protein C1I98_36495 [Spongiactinospora gelatinilytica]|uniref:Uncharacterized protein n=1 Tax=Spongiactinospora gelatinilytica TaxID=2666298 RepID=A0A2W2FLP1_9ACTN|nr:hypothetical protein [Spongiactinospora gelatinilytica]PZG22757.1 hypothetical protein C1I98_36495 [Spongiactinospora gelatinilytica]
MRTYRRLLTWVLTLACAAGALIALADIDTPLRFVLTPLYLLVVPAVAAIGLLRDRDGISALTFGTGASLLVNVLLAQGMLFWDAWSPRAAVATIAALGGFLYVLRVLHRGDTGMRRNMSSAEGMGSP